MSVVGKGFELYHWHLNSMVSIQKFILYNQDVLLQEKSQPISASLVRDPYQTLDITFHVVIIVHSNPMLLSSCLTSKTYGIAPINWPDYITFQR